MLISPPIIRFCAEFVHFSDNPVEFGAASADVTFEDVLPHHFDRGLAFGADRAFVQHSKDLRIKSVASCDVFPSKAKRQLGRRKLEPS